MKSLFLVLMLLSFKTFAQVKELAGYDPKVDQIAENYEAGSFLIYDCVEGHWTCVLEEYSQECTEKYKQDETAKKEQVRCVPMTSFPTKKSCFQRQLYLTSQNFSTRFCEGQSWAQRTLDF